MPTRLDHIPDRRAIVDRRALADRLAALPEREARLTATAILKEALAEGRAEIARRLEERPYAGTETAAAYAFLTDQILRLAYDFVVSRLYPLNVPTASERLLLMGVGGYGRGEMALHSDVDIAFVTPWKATTWTEQVIEALLYLLWDLGLKVGQSTRSVDEMVRLASTDHTIRTAILESRYVWGDEHLCDEAHGRFWREVVAGNAQKFVTEKLEERNARHRRWATAATWSNRTSRKARAAFAISTRSSGSANMSIRCARSRIWWIRACSRSRSFASSRRRSVSCGRCAATCI
jgi:[protein-PII] uridylyltransferase